MIKNVYCLWGDNTYLIDRKITELTSEFGGDVINMDDIISFSELIQTSNEGGLFVQKKSIIIKNKDILKDSGGLNNFEHYLKNQNENTMIIFRFNYPLDKRKKIVKTLIKESISYELKNLNESDLYSFIKEEFYKIGLEIDREGAYFLIASLGNNQSIIENEIKKIELYNFETKSIGKDELKNIISTNISGNIFNLTDGLLGKDKEKVLKSYRNLKLLKETDYKIMFMLIKFHLDLIKIKYLNKHLGHRDMIIKELNMHPFVYDKFNKKINEFSFINIMEKLELLYNYEYEVKYFGDANLADKIELFLIEY